jgi:hypothetical protein
MKKERLINVINNTVSQRLGLILVLLGIFVCVVTAVMVVADKMVTYISGTTTIVSYLFLLIRYISNINSEQKKKIKT